MAPRFFILDFFKKIKYAKSLPRWARHISLAGRTDDSDGWSRPFRRATHRRLGGRKGERVMDLKELEKYRPIRYGGLLVLAWLALSILAGMGFRFLLQKAVDDSNFVWQCAGFLSAAVLLIGVLVFRANNYWRRNVRGYALCGWRGDKGEIQWGVATEVRDLSLVLALGGWFRRSHIVCWAGKFREGVGAKAMLSRWRVKLVDIHAQAITVRLTDRCGDRVTVSAGNALEIFERFSARLWQDVVRHGLITECVLTSERGEAKKRAEEFEGKWKTACQQREDALVVVAEAIERIDAAKRFIKSKEAQRIREWLDGKLAAMAPMGAPGTVLGAREMLTQPVVCGIGVRAG